MQPQQLGLAWQGLKPPTVPGTKYVHHHVLLQAAAELAEWEDGEHDQECVVCWAQRKTALCMPCGHIAMCNACSQTVKVQSGLCPICRDRIDSVRYLQRLTGFEVHPGCHKGLPGLRWLGFV